VSDGTIFKGRLAGKTGIVDGIAVDSIELTVLGASGSVPVGTMDVVAVVVKAKTVPFRYSY
jgi:hypothetical protein